MRHRTPQFSHIFSGDGYSAGYYSYLWADTLTADACEAFTEAGGAYDKAVAKRLHDHVFSVGNTVDPAEALPRLPRPRRRHRRADARSRLPGARDSGRSRDCGRRFEVGPPRVGDTLRPLGGRVEQRSFQPLCVPCRAETSVVGHPGTRDPKWAPT